MKKLLHKLLFKADKYPQHDFSDKDTVKGIIEGVTEAFAIVGHTADWIEAKTAISAIPVAGKVLNFSYEDGSIFGDIEFNEYGAREYGEGKITSMSVEIGKNDLKLKKVAMLGAMKPAVAETAINFSLEDEMQHLENVICFEFDLMDTTTVETTPNVPVMLEDAKGFVKFATDEEKFALLQEIMETGFSDQFKKAAQTMAYNFGKVEEPVIQFSEEHKKDKAELLQFRSETLSKLVKGKFLPRQEKDVNKMIQFMAVNGSDVYSFSEEEKEKPHVLFGKILAEMPDLSKVYGMKFNAEDVKAVEEVGEAKTATQVTIDIYNKAMEGK